MCKRNAIAAVRDPTLSGEENDPLIMDDGGFARYGSPCEYDAHDFAKSQMGEHRRVYTDDDHTYHKHLPHWLDDRNTYAPSLVLVALLVHW